jgi:hypothetical protein
VNGEKLKREPRAGLGLKALINGDVKNTAEAICGEIV